MAILAQCPECRRKQAAKNKRCRKCGIDLDKAKRAKTRVRYWITYRIPGGNQRKEFVGYSIEEARDADGKRRSQKREGRIFDMLPETVMTFSELTEWFLGLEKVKAKAYFPTLQLNLKSFDKVFGNQKVNSLKPLDLENYQAMRKAQGLSDSYVDQEIGAARNMINKAFDNDLIGGEAVRTFRKVKKLLKRNANARDRILTLEEFNHLMKHLPRHTKSILVTGFYTGMRKGEILLLTWDKVDLKHRVINLDAEDTKDRERRLIPICDELMAIFKAIPRDVRNPNHVFLHKGKPIKDIRTGLKMGFEAAGIPYGHKVRGGFVFHDLRHSFNTYMRKAGVPESVIMQITGHSTREMFDRYNTVDMDDAKQAVARMQNYFASVAQNVALEHSDNKKEVDSIRVNPSI